MVKPILETESARWTHQQAIVNGVRLHYVQAGNGPLVVLLHGFPEFWYSWRHQIPALATAGFQVVAPDLRGYNESDKPAGVACYRLDTLANDVLGLIQTLGTGRAVVAGHDWGGGIAWYLAIHHPQLVEKLIILNSPHPAAFWRALRTSTQLLRSWYMFFFQLPWVPEWLIRAGNFAGLERTLRQGPVRAGAFSDEDIRYYKQALARPGALTAALNYYRALFRYRPKDVMQQVRPIQVPTLLLWGERDRYLSIRLTQGLEAWVPDLRICRLPHASHWVQNDAPDDVNQAMLAFLRDPCQRTRELPS